MKSKTRPQQGIRLHRLNPKTQADKRAVGIEATGGSVSRIGEDSA
jgi:hypothetical protein